MSRHLAARLKALFLCRGGETRQEGAAESEQESTGSDARALSVLRGDVQRMAQEHWLAQARIAGLQDEATALKADVTAIREGLTAVSTDVSATREAHAELCRMHDALKKSHEQVMIRRAHARARAAAVASTGSPF